MKETSNMGFVILISIVATIGGFLFGFDSGVINGTVEGLRTAFNTDSVGTGISVSSMLLGCAVGAFFAGTLADRFGRRSILIVASVFFTISAWGSGIADASGEFIVYRVLGGLAVGAASVLAPAYISEVAPAKYRGTLASVQQIAIISGLFFAFLSNYAIAASAEAAAVAKLPEGADASQIKGSLEMFAWGFEAWRWMFWIELIPAVTFFFALLCIPESPRFLVASGKKEKALGVLTKLMGDHAEEKYTEIEESLAGDHHRPRLKDIITDIHGPTVWVGIGKLKLSSDFVLTSLRPLAWVGIGLATFQQLVGINVVFYYGAVLWQAAGFNESDALLINVISGAVSIAACFVATFFVDRIGRKPLLLAGSIGMGITLGVMAVVFAMGILQEDGTLQLAGKSGIIALIAANLYVFCFNFSWGPVMWIMLGEMFPNQIRGSGLAIAGLAQWGSNFAITLTFPMMLVGIGLGGAYGFYAVCALISAAFIIKFVHETKGKELEEMEG